MKLLFSFFVPSGGVETLNRIRAEALSRYGIECHLHYQRVGAGMQNIEGIPTFITNEDIELYAILQREKYDAVIVSSDFLMIERMRGCAFQGPLIYEVQGLGLRDQAIRTLTEAAPYLHHYCTAALYPQTGHLMELFQSMFPGLRQFCFPNLLDTSQFKYRSVEAVSFPIIGWVGRIEKNKNWRDFLDIGHALHMRIPELRLWMFEDADLYEPEEKAAFDLKVKTLGMEPYLIRHSNVPHKQMPEHFSIIGDSGGFLLSTSILEGFGYAVAEAMSCRCPVLSTDSDGVRSFVTSNETGKFYTRGVISEAVAQALELMENKALREQIRRKAETHIHVHFNSSLYCIHFVSMLNALGVH